MTIIQPERQREVLDRLRKVLAMEQTITRHADWAEHMSPKERSLLYEILAVEEARLMDIMSVFFAAQKESAGP